MADVDIDPIGGYDNHMNKPDEGKAISTDPIGDQTGSFWEPEHKQEMLFGGKSPETTLLKLFINCLNEKLVTGLHQI